MRTASERSLLCLRLTFVHSADSSSSKTSTVLWSGCVRSQWRSSILAVAISSFLTNTAVLTLHQNASVIDIFQWKCQDNQHWYRLLARLNLDDKISRYSCCIGKHCFTANVTEDQFFPRTREWDHHLLQTGELRHYNLTMISSRPETSFRSADQNFTRETTDSWQIHENRSLSIYLISEKPELVFQFNGIPFESSKIISLDSSFLIIDGRTRQLLQTDTRCPLNAKVVAQFAFAINVKWIWTLSEIRKLFILSADQSSLAIWDIQRASITYQSMTIASNTRINTIVALPCGQISHDNVGRVYLHSNEQETKRVLLGQADILASRGNHLVRSWRRFASPATRSIY